mgnify:CR=1 FL=1
MKSTFLLVFAAALAFATADPALAQDQNAAAERARIANQRIYAESELRSRETEQSGETGTPAPTAISTTATAAEASDSAPDPFPAPSSSLNEEAVTASAEAVTIQAPSGEPATVATAAGPVAQAAAAPETIAIDLSPVLDQLRTLGELKDAGYVTDEEFERIKKRLLDGSL